MQLTIAFWLLTRVERDLAARRSVLDQEADLQGGYDYEELDHVLEVADVEREFIEADWGQ